MRVATAPAQTRPRAWAPAAAPQQQTRYHHRLGEMAQSLSRRLGSGALVYYGDRFMPWWMAAWMPHDPSREFLLAEGTFGAICVVPLTDRRFYPHHQPLANLVSFIARSNRELSLHAIGRCPSAD